MIRIIFMALIVYFVLRVVRTFQRAAKVINQRPERMHTTSEPAATSWNKKDVVDADFTEIPDEKGR